MKIVLEDGLDRWVDDQLVTSDQAGAIAAYEQQRGEQGDSRLSLVVEALGYLGAVLALVAGGMLASEAWDQLTGVARVSLSGLATVVVLAAGWWIRDSDTAAVQRLVSLLFAVATAGTAFTTWLAVEELASLADETTVLLVGLATTAVAAALYAVRPRPLQHLALAGGVSAVVGGLLAMGDIEQTLLIGGSVLALGLAWGLVTWAGVLRPDSVGYVVAMLMLGVGAGIISGEYRTPGLLVGIGLSGAAMTISVIERRTLFLAFGAAGIFIFLPQLVFHLFADSIGAPFALLLTGLALVGAAIGMAKLKVGVIDEGTRS